MQNLTPTAARMKAIRDKRAAMTPIRRAKKAEKLEGAGKLAEVTGGMKAPGSKTRII